ncbi:MAG: 5-dehydro-4-deoxy-D-glucuronate isomerase [Lewinellaceae bacterium]|nr:5-dehydro-4-deoxy-D-glucuronate isomerase [Lewinellaceae bacterium]
MQILHTSSPKETAGMNTNALRNQFLLERLFEPDQVLLTYSHYDRMIVGGVMPTSASLKLQAPDALRAGFFLERRELGIINLGGSGTVTAGSTTFTLNKLDCLYLGKGTSEVHFTSLAADNAARFFLLSAPAHRTCPNRFMAAADANPAQLGGTATANARTIYKYIHPDGIESCQLVMGLTILETGSVWNTMPPHTHDRRMEVYCYFDVPEGQRVLHLMGEPEETRHLWVGNHQAVISPPWSIHAGCGTMAYAFIWGMAGENQSFADMDQIAVDSLF